mgnify:CR=1 FL=1
MVEVRFARARARMMGLGLAVMPGDPGRVPSHVLAEFDGLLDEFASIGLDVAEWRMPEPQCRRPSRQRRRGHALDGPPLMLLKARITGFLGFLDSHEAGGVRPKPRLGFAPSKSNEAFVELSMSLAKESEYGCERAASAPVTSTDGNGPHAHPVRSPLFSLHPNPERSVMNAEHIHDQDMLDRILKECRGWVFNGFYRKLHHASCRTLRQRGSEARCANFKWFYPKWNDAEQMSMLEGCPVCKPGAGQPSA